MIRERVQNHDAIPRYRFIKNYDAFVLINKDDANQVSLYKKDYVSDERAYYIRFTNDNVVNIEIYKTTETFDIFYENYDAFIAENVVTNCDIVYDKKPYTTMDNFYNG